MKEEGEEREKKKPTPPPLSLYSFPLIAINTLSPVPLVRFYFQFSNLCGINYCDKAIPQAVTSAREKQQRQEPYKKRGEKK